MKILIVLVIILTGLTAISGYMVYSLGFQVRDLQSQVISSDKTIDQILTETRGVASQVGNMPSATPTALSLNCSGQSYPDTRGAIPAQNLSLKCNSQ